MTRMMVRLFRPCDHIANAYEMVAKCNHFMVGVNLRNLANDEDLRAAKIILIDRENSATSRTAKKRLALALDMFECDHPNQ